MSGTKVAGSIYYVTTNIYKRLPIFSSSSFIIPLLDSLNFYRFQHSFSLLGYVIMPNHLHLLIWPDGHSSIEEIMRDFKKFTAVRLERQAEVEKRADWLAAFKLAGQTTGRSKNKVWQDSYWDTIVYGERILRQKLNYMHRNPVRAGLVQSVEEYPYSSYRNYVQGDQSLIEVDTDWL
jgi:REP element-mobilizing transposase RayT